MVTAIPVRGGGDRGVRVGLYRHTLHMLDIVVYTH